jgi:tetratricopeptide (TPR) repeat protein
MKKSRIAVLTILVAIIAMAAPVSAYFSSQSLDTRAERIVEIADGARDSVLDLVDIVEADTTAMDLITSAGLDEQLYCNVSLCVEAGTTVGGEITTENGTGWEYLYAANQSLLDGEYEAAIGNATEALMIFREVLRSIHAILWEADVETEELVTPQIVQDAIERSLDRISELRALLSEGTEVTSKLDEAEDLLNEAKSLLLEDEIEAAKDNLKEANELISQVCQYLKEVAEELNPSRIRGYLDEASRYRETFRERFGHAWDEEFDVDGFLQKHGYQNEEDFMNRFQQMIENAQGTDDIEEAIQDLNEIGSMIREMDGALTQEMSQHQAQHGQEEASGSGYGQNGGSSYSQGGTGSSYEQGSSGASGGQYGGSGSGFGSMGNGSS